MDTENDCEISKARDAIQMIETIQSMIDVSAERLKGLRTQCLTSAELTQQEIRTLEAKLVKHFSHQLVAKSRISEEMQKELVDVPSLSLWLRVVGLGQDSIDTICAHVSSLELLRAKSEPELAALLAHAREEEGRWLCRAMQRLGDYIDALYRGESGVEMALYWDSWERARGTPRPRRHARGDAGSVQGTPGKKAKSPGSPTPRRAPQSLPPPASLSKSRSHESRLSARPDASTAHDISIPSDTSQTSVAGEAGSPPVSPGEDPARAALAHNTSGTSTLSRSPRTPVTRSMAHDIRHRFHKSFNMLTCCDYCDKQILFGTGLKCKECKFKCHRECESKVPPSCGLPPEFVLAFREKFDGSYHSTSSPVSHRAAGLLASLTRPHRRPQHSPASGNPDSSSTTSSCNSSAPSSPAPAPPAPPAAGQFRFPEVTCPSSPPGAAQDELAASIKSDKVSISLSEGSADSGAPETADDDARWPRQNSLSMKEWDIPYDELQLTERIGRGRAGAVWRGGWHGAVAVKLLHVPALGDDKPRIEFQREVATLRKTRHENIVLFMGACMKPPKLAIVTSLCRGLTLYTHVHVRKDKFNANKSIFIAQQLCQGMGYLHARGITHKDLKTKNVFLENGRVVITDFGLFSVTKLCFENDSCGDRLGIPAGWLAYLAPELVRALRPVAGAPLPFSQRTDVFAYSTIMYELLTNEWPFEGQPAEAVIWQVGRGVKQSLPNINSSRDIKDMITACWSYRPADRPDFVTLLANIQKFPRKRLARSPSHPVHLSRAADL